MHDDEQEIINAKKELSNLYLLIKMQKKDKVKITFLFNIINLFLLIVV